MLAMITGSPRHPGQSLSLCPHKETYYIQRTPSQWQLQQGIHHKNVCCVLDL